MINVDLPEMNTISLYSPAEIKKFSSTVLRPLLATDFVPFHGNRDLVRQKFNFVQLVALSGGRYGETLKVLPTFYVVGARPSDQVIPQSLALSAERPDQWRFQGLSLNTSLAHNICERLKIQSPLSFFSSIGADAIVSALKTVCADSISEDAHLYLAFFMMANGIAGERLWIEKARKNFLKQNPVIQHEWQRTTMQRIDLLEQRIDAKDAAILCQQEANDQSVRLRLPKIDWSVK